MTDPNAQPQAAPAAAPAPSPAPAQPQGAPAAAPAWSLEIDDRTTYNDPAKAKESFLDARRQISEFNALKEKLGGFRIAFEDGTERPASEDPEGFIALVNDLLAKQAAPAGQPAAQPGAEKLDVSKLSPEYQQHIDILRRSGQFAAADQIEKMAKELESIKQQVAGVAQYQSANEQSRIKTAREEGAALVADVAKAAGFPIDEKSGAALARAIEEQIVEASSDPKTGNMVPGSLEDRFLRGDRSTREAIIKEQFVVWQSLADGYAKTKNAAYAGDKAKAMSGQPRPLAPGTGTPSNGPVKRPSESERMEKLRELLSAQSA